MFRIARWTAVLFLFLLLASAAEASSLQDSGNSTKNSVSHLQEVGASQIVTEIEANQAVSYDNVFVLGNLDLSKLTGPVRQSVEITNSIIQGPANFERVTFGDLMDFHGTTFQGNASFAKARFQGDANFGSTRFFGNTDFRFARFDSAVSFSLARFDGVVSFANSQFDGNAVFEGSNFDTDAKFDLVQFSRPVTFRGAIFSGDASITNSQFSGTTIFMDSNFKGNADFAGTQFVRDVIFRSSHFYGGSSFGLASFGGFADFANVTFENTAFFAVAKFDDNAHFLDAKFNKDLVLESARIYNMQLDNATFGKNSTISLKDADFTRLVVPWSTIRDRLEFNGAAYLALVKNYKNLEWFNDADDCYYEYRQISQANEPLGWAKLVDVIAWLSCGYGVRVSYTAFWCIFTIVLFGVVFWAGNGMKGFEQIGQKIPGRTKGIQKQRVSLIDAMYFSVAQFNSAQGPVNRYPVGFYRHLAMLEIILGWFFMMLFVVILVGILIR
jgi:hypothetical protein